MHRILTTALTLTALGALPSTADAGTRCWNTGLGYRYCANTAAMEFSFEFADANSGDAGDEVTATMEMDQVNRRVRFLIDGKKCKGSVCNFSLTSQYTSPWMQLVTMGTTPTDDDIVYAPFQVTIRLGKGMDSFVGKTKLTRPNGSVWTVNYFPATVHGQSGRDIIKYATEADGGDGRDKIWGTPYGDLLKGGHGADEIEGRAGDDHILGQGGDDDIWGNGGNDYIDGGFSGGCNSKACNDQTNKCWGGGGNDRLYNCY